LDRDELHISEAQSLEDLDEASMDYGNSKRGPTEVERFPWHIDRKADHSFRGKEPALAKLPGIDLLPLLIKGTSQVPTSL
jgi:hypothetical protein